MTTPRRLQGVARRIFHAERRLTRLRGRSERLSWARVALFLPGLVLSVVAFFIGGAAWFWATLAATLGGFGWVVARHRRVDGSIGRLEGWLALQQAQRARMTLAWDGLPPSVGPPPDPAHPFEADLDLVGERSLHHLLDTSVTTEGSLRLRAWLTAPVPELAQTERRRALVRELRPLAALRDRLIVEARLAAGARGQWDARRLDRWLAQPARAGSLAVSSVALSGLALVTLVLALLDWLGRLPPLWIGSLGLYALVFTLRGRALGDLFDEALTLQVALRQLSAVSRVLERRLPHGAPHLQTLCAPLRDPAQRPTHFLRHAQRVLTAIGLRQHPLVWLALNVALPWDFFCALALDRLRRALAPLVPLWLDRWADLEALSALANLGWLHPDYTFPDIVTDEAGPVFRATALGHPLIADEGKVVNDFALGGVGELALLTGSNMAGKSSFLRAVGVNLALASAGGVVHAAALRTVPLRLFSSMRVADSLADGISYFYAEVQRLKRLLDEAERDHPFPLVYFVDEIFRGTNNRERLLGSRALLRALLRTRTVGLVATHDLELVRLADDRPPVRLYHFRETVADGRMQFDFLLRPGPSPTTNALLIMRLAGLPVGKDEGS